MLLFRVAELLGQPVWFVRVAMTKDELYKWISYINNKPPTVQEQQMAVLSTMVANALGGKKKAKVQDFLISKSPDKKVKGNDLTAMRSIFGVSKK